MAEAERAAGAEWAAGPTAAGFAPPRPGRTGAGRANPGRTATAGRTTATAERTTATERPVTTDRTTTTERPVTTDRTTTTDRTATTERPGAERLGAERAGGRTGNGYADDPAAPPGAGRGPHTAPQPPRAAPFSAERLLLVGTGALSVAFLPFWVNWLRIAHPRVELRLAVTRSAARFVSRLALEALTGGEVLLDAWPEGPGPRLDHVELAEWPDAVAVHPAGMHFVARLALGLADTPVLMALQCTRAVIGVAPALPPGAEGGAAYRRHLKELKQYANVVVAPPHPGRSASTGRDDAAAAAPLPDLLALIERHRQEGLAAAKPRAATAAPSEEGIVR